MRIQIDINESIRKNRLVIIGSRWDRIIEIIGYIFLAAIFIFLFLIALIFLYKTIIGGKLNAFLIIFLSIFFIIGFLTVYGLLNEYKLKRIRGKEFLKNKQLITDILKDRFNGGSFYTGNKMVTYYKRSDFWNFAIRIIVLFDDKDLLINISKFNQNEIKSFFHPFFNERLINSIAEEFNEHIQESVQQKV